MFTYTDEEQEHFKDLLEHVRFSIWMGHDEFETPEYYRYCAALEREQPSNQYSSHGYPHPDDCDIYSSAEDYEEMADELECGKQKGEDCY